MNYVEEQVRHLILPKKERSIDGIWSHRAPLPRKPTATTPSGALRMSKSLAYDFFLAAATVVPAVAIWIASESTLLGVSLGLAAFVSIEYGIPAYKAGKLNPTPIIEFARPYYAFLRTQYAHVARPARTTRRA